MPKRSLPQRTKERSKKGQSAVDLNWDDNIESSDDDDERSHLRHETVSSESEEELTVEQQRKKWDHT